jgi:hypothetical protein
MTASITPATPLPLAIPYTTGSGERRQALIGVDEQGVYFVYDTPATTTGHVVARLDGADEKLPEAISLIADYVKNQIAYADGERVDDPLPKPEVQPLSKIASDWRRAATAAITDASESEELKRFYQLATDAARHQALETEQGAATVLADPRKEAP